MKIQFSSCYLLLLVAGVFLVITSFSEPYYYENWKYTPVFMKRSDLEQSVSFQTGARVMENPGKIYFKPPYIFINEKYKGVHIINNANPQNPVNEGFIVAPGCIDIAVKGTVMYLDNSVDLVAFDLSSKQVTKRIRNVFPEPVSPDNEFFHHRGSQDDFILVGWKTNPNYNKGK